MPKEYINPTFFHPETSDDPYPHYQVRVGWDRHGGSVQLATVNEDAELGSLESGLYVDMTRHDINALIRLLRKARDQCYGRDE